MRCMHGEVNPSLVCMCLPHIPMLSADCCLLSLHSRCSYPCKTHCPYPAGAEDADIAVFRFTLGIPGFDDALIPRVVGVLGAALLIANHLSDQTQATAAQAGLIASM